VFFISGAALLALTYGGVAHTHGAYSQVLPAPVIKQRLVEAGPQGGETVSVIDSNQRNVDLRVLAFASVIALVIMAAVSMALGWLIAGRVLRPLRTITTAAREISVTNLHQRLALEGPDDEFKELGDTFDELLARLDASFQSQRQFVANASHELRTPLARLKTLAQVALADPDATPESLRTAHERVLAAEGQLEGLIEALLSLASSERGLDRREPVDLMAVTGEVLATHRPEIEHQGLQLNVTLDAARVEGNARLLERLVGNLLDNAIRYNTTLGKIDVTTTTEAGQAVLLVANDGPIIPAGELDRLGQPFQRLGVERVGLGDGHGLGLSIVRAVAAAHGAAVSIRARTHGGLDIEVWFPVERSGPASHAAR
jgi:signal transduction histidine kinase